jgi:hypothetical protein
MLLSRETRRDGVLADLLPLRGRCLAVGGVRGLEWVESQRVADADARAVRQREGCRISRPIWFVAIGAVALELAVSPLYGYQRDELYFLAAGRRLAWGYLDQRP